MPPVLNDGSSCFATRDSRCWRMASDALWDWRSWLACDGALAWLFCDVVEVEVWELVPLVVWVLCLGVEGAFWGFGAGRGFGLLEMRRMDMTFPSHWVAVHECTSSIPGRYISASFIIASSSR